MVVDNFHDLVAWQLADQLRREVLAFTRSGSVSKDFKYRDQIRDAIASACRNTSEGFDRFRPAEFARFLEIARGSLGEKKDCLIDGRDRGYIDDEQFERLFTLARRAQGTNTNLGKYLRQCIAKGRESWRTKERTGNARPERARKTRTRTQEPKNPRTQEP